MNNRHREPQTIGRMVQRLMILDGVLGDRHCWWMGPENGKRTFFSTTRQMGIASRIPASHTRSPAFPTTCSTGDFTFELLASGTYLRRDDTCG
jgi:hypothetical protein